jgi:hypothetical protein
VEIDVIETRSAIDGILTGGQHNQHEKKGENEKTLVAAHGVTFP